MLSTQIQTQNFTIIKTKNQINNLPSKIGMGMGMGMVRKNEGVWGWQGERGRKDLVVREREPMGMGRR